MASPSDVFHIRLYHDDAADRKLYKTLRSVARENGIKPAVLIKEVLRSSLNVQADVHANHRPKERGRKPVVVTLRESLERIEQGTNPYLAMRAVGWQPCFWLYDCSQCRSLTMRHSPTETDFPCAHCGTNISKDDEVSLDGLLDELVSYRETEIVSGRLPHGGRDNGGEMVMPAVDIDGVKGL